MAKPSFSVGKAPLGPITPQRPSIYLCVSPSRTSGRLRSLSLCHETAFEYLPIMADIVALYLATQRGVPVS
jgi:hypothetical protein